MMMPAPESQTFVTHLECGYTGEVFPADTVQELSSAGKPLLVKYDLDSLGGAVDKGEYATRPDGMWRYREFLPVRSGRDVVSLGESDTPLIPLSRMAKRLGATSIVMKDEGRLPTGSFKARGLAMAVSMAKELGLTRLAMPTNGNAGAALAAYGTRAGMETYIFCPADTPEVNVREIALQGGKVWRVNGLINDCGKIVGAGKERMGWFDVSTLKEPYRIEGKKTMGLELADQLGWQVPDVIFYPRGGGTGLIGMWKAFNELKEIGWISGDLPRMVAVQSSGCASGIRVPVAVGDFLILDAVRESDGFAIAVDDSDIAAAHARVPSEDGMLICPEGAATVTAYEQALESGLVSKEERAVLFNCGSGLKYPMPPADRVHGSGRGRGPVIGSRRRL
jgi:threonine synthase